MLTIDDLRKAIEGIVTLTNTQTLTQTFNNGDEFGYLITTTNSAGARLLTTTDVSLYVGSVADANELPGGSNITESQWQVIGPVNSWGRTDNKNTKTLYYLRNISAGTVSVTIKVDARTITNSLTVQTSGT